MYHCRSARFRPDARVQGELKSALLPHLAKKERNVVRGENMDRDQSEKLGCLPPQAATTFLTKFLMGTITSDEVGEFDITTAKFDRVLQWAPGHGPYPGVVRKRKGRLRTFQATKNFLRIVESMKNASANTEQTEAAVAQVMQETGFSRKTVYGALKIWKGINSGW